MKAKNNAMVHFNRKHYITLAILGVLILTNPSRSAFVSYLHQTEYDGVGRDFNAIVFSIYSEGERLTTKELLALARGKNIPSRRIYYIGILGNFIKSPF